MGLFIDLAVNWDTCLGIEECGECIEVCPVNVFEDDRGELKTVYDSEDECTLCDMCIQKCPVEALTIVKHYESSAA
jgi:NAD-dependent dihydropyrimidine dehydrogenase PreA subunit